MGLSAGKPPATLAQLLDHRPHLHVLAAGLCHYGLLQVVQQLSWLEVDVSGLHRDVCAGGEAHGQPTSLEVNAQREAAAPVEFGPGLQPFQPHMHRPVQEAPLAPLLG